MSASAVLSSLEGTWDYFQSAQAGACSAGEAACCATVYRHNNYWLLKVKEGTLTWRRQIRTTDGFITAIPFFPDEDDGMRISGVRSDGQISVALKGREATYCVSVHLPESNRSQLLFWYNVSWNLKPMPSTCERHPQYIDIDGCAEGQPVTDFRDGVAVFSWFRRAAPAEPEDLAIAPEDRVAAPAGPAASTDAAGPGLPAGLVTAAAGFVLGVGCCIAWWWRRRSRRRRSAADVAQEPFEVPELDSFTENQFAEGDPEKILGMGTYEHWVLRPGSLTVDEEAAHPGSVPSVRHGWLDRGTEVAVKQAGKEDEKRVFNELRVLRMIRHPNILLFHGATHSESHGILLALEWVPGCSLNRYVPLRRQSGEFGQQVEGLMRRAAAPATGRAMDLLMHEHRLLLDVARALQFMHSPDPAVVHLNVQPSSVRVATGREPPLAKVADFERAVLRKRGTAPQKLGVPGKTEDPCSRAEGPPEFLAPEVASGGLFAASADAFSFGCVAAFTIMATRHEPAAAVRTLAKEGCLGSAHIGSLAAVLPVVKACPAVEPAERPNLTSVYRGLSPESCG